jgi:hypothetical protein
MKTAPRNALPFELIELENLPIDLLDQKAMRSLRTIADRKGLTVVEVIGEAIELFAASHPRRAGAEEEKILKFPAPTYLTVMLRPSSARRPVNCRPSSEASPLKS